VIRLVIDVTRELSELDRLVLEFVKCQSLITLLWLGM